MIRKWFIILQATILIVGLILRKKDGVLNLGDTYYVFNLFELSIAIVIVMLLIYLMSIFIGRFRKK